jgi:anti-sigma B factor antagonist
MTWSEITTRVSGDVVVLDVSANVSLCGQTEIPHVVSSLMQQGFLKFLINLHRLPYIDSGGLAGVARAYTMASRQGGTVKFVNVAPRVRELFDFTRLSSVFEVFDSEERALESFAAPSPREQG